MIYNSIKEMKSKTWRGLTDYDREQCIEDIKHQIGTLKLQFNGMNIESDMMDRLNIDRNKRIVALKSVIDLLNSIEI